MFRSSANSGVDAIKIVDYDAIVVGIRFGNDDRRRGRSSRNLWLRRCFWRGRLS
jgi:hypothetical protein